MNESNSRVIVIGTSVSAGLAAAFLKTQFPDLEVLAVGPETETRPLVGESIVEAVINFMEDIGLEPYLRQTQHKKHGLTFYYRMTQPNGETDERYSVHESYREPNTTASLINREEFDLALRRRCEELGVEYVHGKVEDVAVDSDLHRVTVKRSDGEIDLLEAKWLIDASGRSRVLAKKLGLTRKNPPEEQRNAFWLRLVDFDESAWLDGMRLEKAVEPGYDNYLCAHHFMGRGNWVWGIPLRNAEGRKMMSLGITWHPRFSSCDVRSPEEFIKAVALEHPSLARFMGTGTVYDYHVYRNYLYSSERVFSPDRWYMLGDAAQTVDPLYSTGLLFTTLQIRQVAEIIGRDREGTLESKYVEDLNTYFLTQIGRIQERIGRRYEVMHDPWQSSMSMHWDTLEYMYFYLPLFAGGYHWQPAAVAKALTSVEFLEAEKMDRGRAELLKASRVNGTKRGQLYLYDQTINYNYDRRTCEPAKTLSRGLTLRCKLRWKLLKLARFRGASEHLPLLFKDLFGSAALRLLGDRALSS